VLPGGLLLRRQTRADGVHLSVSESVSESVTESVSGRIHNHNHIHKRKQIGLKMQSHKCSSCNTRRESEMDDRDPGDEHQDPVIPFPHPTRFVRYGTGPGEYFEPVNFRQERDRD